KLQHQSSALNDNDPKNDWTEATEYGTESKVIKFGTLDIKVLFEADNEIYLQSEKGIKLLKPEPAFLEYLNSTE
ncbi:MAG: hypothetical protein RR486_12465, partial [Clostridium sp.]|uniref:hypothetical protein n=1 Tax=Clostridium sp. TaxID=1506 RepID=UPI003044E102